MLLPTHEKGASLLSTLHLTLLGQFSLLVDRRPVGMTAPARLPELLTYLVLHPQPHARRDIAFLLWPDTSEAQAQANLRKLVYQLRVALPEVAARLQIDARRLHWQPDAAVTCDFPLFTAALARVAQAVTDGDEADRRLALQQAVALYGGDLLRSSDVEWILPLREQLRRTFFATLEGLILLLESRGEYAAAIEAAHRLVAEDPLHEASYRYLMRLYATRGDRADALHVYHTCATVLQRELRVDPSPTTHAVYEALLTSDASVPQPAVPQLIAEPGLVGRRTEWAQLQAAWSAARTGRPRLLLLVGDAGIGKTRLTVEFIEWVARQGCATATAHCYAAEQGLAYATVVAWLRALHGIALVAPWQQELVRLLPELGDGTLPPDPPAAGGQQQLFEALARALLTTQPCLYFVDDLQWCDPESLTWLHFLLHFDSQAQVLIVGTLRPEEVGADHPLQALLTSQARAGRLHEIALGPLDAAETTRLATELATHEIAADAATRLYRETEGNPLLVVEMVRAALEPSAVGVLRLARPPRSTSALPPRVQALLQARLAPLSAEAREVVNLAAVIGREFSLAMLARAGRWDEEALVRALDELWQRRIIRERGDDAYDFSHDKLREIAYVSLGLARRRMLHRQVAQTLIALPAGVGAGVTGAAAHFERAGLPAEAVRYYQQAGAEALRVFAPATAIAALERAIHLLPAAQVRAPGEEEWGALGAQLYASLSLALTQTGELAAQKRPPQLTDLQQRKINRVFAAFDSDDDGFLVTADHTRMIAEIAALRGWAPDSDPYATVQSIYMSMWAQLRPLSATDEGRVSRAAYQAYMAAVLGDPEAFAAAARPGIDFMFDLFDSDADGRLTAAEYGAFLRIYRTSAADIAATFARLDRAGAGAIGKDAFYTLFTDFHLSDDPQAPGNYFLGPF